MDQFLQNLSLLSPRTTWSGVGRAVHQRAFRGDQ